MPNQHEAHEGLLQRLRQKAARQATGGASITPGCRVAPALPMMASRRPGCALPLTPSRMRFGALSSTSPSPPFDLLFLGASV